MTKPYPPELILSAPALTWPWRDHEDPAAGERKFREYLEGFRLENGRVLLMAKEEAFKTLASDPEVWDSEPWYGTKYRVDRFDEAFIKEVRPQ